ncbi:MAG: hypothetical protein ACHQXA_05110 [Gemmatimonadales bacterium]
MVRSITAVVLGFVLIGVLSIGGDLAFRALAPAVWTHGVRMSNPAALVLTETYAALFTIFGCWLCARLAPSHPMRHALILGGVSLAFGIANTIKLWNTAPAWYHLVALALAMPLAWVGGEIHEIQRARASGR